MTIYRKYRARNFQEIVGQTHVVQILKRAVVESRLAHAYLFTGPRGTGKTSMARILSKAVNCLAPVEGEPCNECSNCKAINESRFMDLIEIDAASNRGIDEIRSLKETISFLPVEGKHKIYIIDEVHMLTEPAFNALLKTLEEPPAKVLFILATTEPHKLPLTIISRTQRFDFRLADATNLRTKLSRILEAEAVPFEEDALELIIKAGQGSYRDAETVLEKVLSSLGKEARADKIKRDQIEALLGYVSAAKVAEFLEALMKGDRSKSLELFDSINSRGANLSQFLKEVMEHARQLMIDGVAGKRGNLQRILQVIKELNQANLELKTTLINALPIEVAIINLTTPVGAVKDSVSFSEKQPVQSVKVIEVKEPKPEKVEKKQVIIQEEPQVSATEEAETAPGDIDPGKLEEYLAKLRANWPDIMQEAKKFNHFLAAILMRAEFEVNSEEGLLLKVTSSFHKKQLDSPETRKVLNKIIASNLGTSLSFKCIIDKNLKTNQVKSSNAKLVEELLQ